jgi:hypothetical protein
MEMYQLHFPFQIKSNIYICSNFFIYSQDEGAESSGGGKDVVFQRFGSHHRKIIPKRFFGALDGVFSFYKT